MGDLAAGKDLDLAQRVEQRFSVEKHEGECPFNTAQRTLPTSTAPLLEDSTWGTVPHTRRGVPNFSPASQSPSSVPSPPCSTSPGRCLPARWSSARSAACGIACLSPGTAARPGLSAHSGPAAGGGWHALRHAWVSECDHAPATVQREHRRRGKKHRTPRRLSGTLPCITSPLPRVSMATAANSARYPGWCAGSPRSGPAWT